MVKRDVVVPVGSRVQGRIRRLEQYAKPFPYFVVGIEFTEVEVQGIRRLPPLPGNIEGRRREFRSCLRGQREECDGSRPQLPGSQSDADGHAGGGSETPDLPAPGAGGSRRFLVKRHQKQNECDR